MNIDFTLSRLDKAVENGEMSESEAREEMRWLKSEYDDEWRLSDESFR